MGLLSSGAKAAAKNAVSDAGLLSPGIRAYHGSPHDFDSFSTSQIGTGEGAQAYGRGLYFAEREGTAQSYREALSGKNASFEDGSFVPEWVLTAQKNGKLKEAKLDFQDRVKQINEMMDRSERPHLLKEQLDTNTKILQGIERLEGGDIPKVGRMYEVNIAATPDQFIDWDLPLDEQSESVKSALKKTDWYQYAEEGAINAAARRRDNAYGMDLVRYLEEDGAEDAVQMLKDAGIKGVQYADAQTRFGKGPKTKNYVVYDDKLISISKKYGISIPAAAAIAAGTMTPEEAQAGPLSAGARRIIDPRFSQPVAGGKERKAVRGALETMQTDIDPRLMDIGSPVTLQDYEGYPYMLTQSDRSAAGGMLTGIHGQSIDPVNLQGGRDFMFDPQSKDLVWASDPDVVKTMYKRAMKLREKFGKDPILLPYTMAPTGIDFARMPLDTMINYARQGMSKANIKKLDSQIKKVIPGWTSVMDPEVNAMFRDVGGNQRKMIANIIDKNFRDVPGGLSMGEARAATSDIAQYTSPDGSLLNVGRIDTSQAPIADSGHSTYKGGLVGEGIGRLTEGLDVRPFMAARGRELTGGPEDIRSLSMNPAFSQGVVDEKLLRNIYDTQSGRLQEIATKYGVSIPVAAMALMGDAEEASASDGGMGVRMPPAATQGLVPFDKDLHTPRDVGLGGLSSEYTMTVDAPDGQVAVIPSIWWDADGEPVVLDQRDAERRSFEYEQQTGKQFPRFPAGGYELADEYAQARSSQGGASESPLASEYPSLGGMGVRMPPTAEDEEAMLAPTGGDLMQQANRDFAGAIRTQPEPDFLTGVQQSLLSGIMKTAGVADLSADVVSAMAGPLLSAPGAIARYAADRYVPGVNYTAEEMAQGRRETEDYFNYQPRTEQGPQYGEQIMQGIGGAIAPYVPAIKKAAGDSYILGAMNQGYDYLGDKEKMFFEALGDIFSPI